MASKVNIEIEQGASFNLSIDLKNSNNDPMVVTGFTSYGQIRKHPQSNIYYSFTTALANGELSLYMSANTTANISQGLYLYDVFLVKSNTETVRIVAGMAVVSPSVSRP